MDLGQSKEQREKFRRSPKTTQFLFFADLPLSNQQVIFNLDTVTNASVVHNHKIIHHKFMYTTRLRIFCDQHFLHVTITLGKSTQLLMVIHNLLTSFGKYFTPLLPTVKVLIDDFRWYICWPRQNIFSKENYRTN